MVRGRLILCGLMALAGCRAAPLPERHVLPEHPRIISMNPCIDAILARVADDDQVVSISHYSQDPRATSSPLSWARRHHANWDTAEEIIALKPDLVMVGPHVAKPTIAAIERDHVATVTVDVPLTIDDSFFQIRTVAQTVGYPERGEQLIAEIKRGLAAATPAPGTPRIGALIWQAGGLVPGSGTLADELLVRTGFTNQSAAYGLQMWDVLPVEPILAHPPAIIFRASEDRMSGSDRLSRSGVLGRLQHITQVDVFPERLLYCAGPNLIEAANRLAKSRRDYLAAKATRS